MRTPLDSGGRRTGGLQNRLRGAVEASWVGSIPIHPRQISAMKAKVTATAAHRSERRRTLTFVQRWRTRLTRGWQYSQFGAQHDGARAGSRALNLGVKRLRSHSVRESQRIKECHSRFG